MWRRGHIWIEGDEPLSVRDAFGDLCAVFCEAAIGVWNDLADTHRAGSLSEDSITDYLLLNMRRKTPALVYHRYTRHQESRVSGADWLWVFHSNSRGLPLLVQAKKLYPTSLCYEALTYKRSKPSQLNTLERHAREIRLCPLVCFYNCWPGQQHWTSSRFSGDDRLWGAAVAKVSDVQRALRTNAGNSLGSIGPLSMPWHTLVCPDAASAVGSENLSLPDRIRVVITQRFGTEGRFNPEIRDGLPRNLNAIAAESPGELFAILGIEPELRESLGGVAIVTQTTAEARGDDGPLV